MNIDEIPTGYTTSYVKTFSLCGLNQEILTQCDDRPEYYTEIYLQCQCGEYIEFVLPVN